MTPPCSLLFDRRGRERKKASRLRRQPVRPPIQEGHLADVVLAEQLHQQTREPEAEAAVRRRAEAEEVEVVLDRAGLDALVPRLCDQLLVTMLPLRPGRQLDAAPQQVEALRQALI